MSNYSILIAGATGYIGVNLIRRLAQENYEIYAVARSSSNTMPINNFVKKIVSFDTYEELYQEICELQLDCFINLAGYFCAKHTENNLENLLDSNLIFQTYVIDAAIQAGIKYVINTSSYRQRYDNSDYHPMNLYGAIKQAYADILAFYSYSGQVSVMELELFDTYGADDTRNKVFNYVRRLEDGEELSMSAGKQKLYFCYIGDVVEAYIKAIDLLEKEDLGYNKKFAVRSETPIELKKFIEKYIDITGKRVNLHWGMRAYEEKEIMDPTGYGEILPDWKANISYDMGLQLCGEYDIRQREKIK